MSTSALPSTTTVVDVNVPRFNQGVIAALTAFAFVGQLPVLVVLTFGILVVSRAFGPRWAPLTQLYVRWVRPRLTQSEIEYEDARPPAFSQLLGTVVLGSASAAFVLGAPVLGWTLTLIVTALASLAAVARICVGCVLYERLGLSDRA